jgi:transcription initiation factor TFIIIB Brf1 subunit/transcription initiation factor TFIIB
MSAFEEELNLLIIDNLEELKVFNEIICQDDIIRDDIVESSKLCRHINHTTKQGMKVCEDCGVEMQIYTLDPEWDNKSKTSSYNTNKRSDNIRNNVDKVLKECKSNIPAYIKQDIQDRYKKIINNSSNRKSGSKALIAACFYNVYKDMDLAIPIEDIEKEFGIKRYALSKGIKEYIRVFKGTKLNSTKAYNFTDSVMIKIDMEKCHSDNIKKICLLLEDATENLIKSKSYSTACAFVYLYLCLNPSLKQKLNLNIKKYSDLVSLSEITLNTLIKDCIRMIIYIMNDGKDSSILQPLKKKEGKRGRGKGVSNLSVTSILSDGEIKDEDEKRPTRSVKKPTPEEDFDHYKNLQKSDDGKVLFIKSNVDTKNTDVIKNTDIVKNTDVVKNCSNAKKFITLPCDIPRKTIDVPQKIIDIILPNAINVDINISSNIIPKEEIVNDSKNNLCQTSYRLLSAHEVPSHLKYKINVC